MASKRSSVTVEQLEQALAKQAAGLAKRAPKQLLAIKKLMVALKSGKPVTAGAKKLLRELAVWQLDLKRATYAAQLERMRATPQTSKQQVALENMMRVLDEAKKALTEPTPGSRRALGVAAQRARTSVTAAVVAEQARTRASAPSRPSSRHLATATPPARQTPLRTSAENRATPPGPMTDPDATPPPPPSPPARAPLAAFKPPLPGTTARALGVPKKPTKK